MLVLMNYVNCTSVFTTLNVSLDELCEYCTSVFTTLDVSLDELCELDICIHYTCG